MESDEVESVEQRMYFENNTDLYTDLINQVETTFDLDRPGIELIKIDRSKFGVTNYPKSHVHEVLILKIDNKLYYAKGEDVYLRVSSRYSLNYKSFLEFSLSLFQFDDYSVPERVLPFFDEPEIPAVSFDRMLIQRQLATIESITDDNRPSDIDDPKLRALFIYYLSRKERLVYNDGEIYDDVFNHHGRDLIHEVLASVLGQLLGIPVPRNYFGYKTSEFKLASVDKAQYTGPEHQRYILSGAIHNSHPCPFLVDVLNKKFREQNISWGLSLFRDESNPLNLRFFQEYNSSDTESLGNLIIARCLGYRDLIRSDFLDRILDGTKDRKPYDYLLPKGLQGPIFTVDFGEILFPEIMFNPREPHYIEQKDARAAALSDYLSEIGKLQPDNPYRSTAAELVLKVHNTDLDMIARLVNAIPERFFLDHLDSNQFCYQSETMIDFLKNQFQIIADRKDI